MFALKIDNNDAHHQRVQLFLTEINETLSR